MNIIEHLGRAVCYVIGCRWEWYAHGDPLLCPPGVEPWHCRRCKRHIREKNRHEYARRSRL